MTKTVVTGIYLRKDLSELITEKFVKVYNVDISKWITPFGYYDEAHGSIISNNGIPDGVYITLGGMQYPGKNYMSHHIIYQFNLARNRGIDLRWATRFQPYPNVPKAVKLRPVYPMFRVAEPTNYGKCKQVFNEIQKKQHFTVDELKSIIRKEGPASIKNTIYRMRLALQREIEKDRRKY